MLFRVVHSQPYPRTQTNSNYQSDSMHLRRSQTLLGLLMVCLGRAFVFHSCSSTGRVPANVGASVQTAIVTAKLVTLPNIGPFPIGVLSGGGSYHLNLSSHLKLSPQKGGEVIYQWSNYNAAGGSQPQKFGLFYPATNPENGEKYFVGSGYDNVQSINQF